MGNEKVSRFIMYLFIFISSLVSSWCWWIGAWNGFMTLDITLILAFSNIFSEMMNSSRMESYIRKVEKCRHSLAWARPASRVEELLVNFLCWGFTSFLWWTPTKALWIRSKQLDLHDGQWFNSIESPGDKVLCCHSGYCHAPNSLVLSKNVEK